MYDLFWYDANLGSYDSLEEASVRLFYNYQCTDRELTDVDVNAWNKEGSGIKKAGRWLSTLELLYLGRRLSALWNSYEYHNASQFRNGSVNGIRKWRGGGGYYRRVRTMAERRQNMGVSGDEGVGLVRARRSGRNLPNTWDDIQRSRERGWKAQYRGKKAWDKRS